MSGPIVRTGTNPKFWKNWDRVFGDKTAATDKKSVSKSSKGSRPAATAGEAHAAAPKKAAKKAAKKSAKKK